MKYLVMALASSCAAPAAQVQGEGVPDVAALFRQLGSEQHVQAAWTQLIDLREQLAAPAVLAVRADPAPALEAIARARTTLPTGKPRARPWFEAFVGACLADFGLQREASSGLTEYLGPADDLAAPPEALRERAKGLVLLAELHLAAGDLTGAERVAARAVQVAGVDGVDADAQRADALGVQACVLVRLGLLAEADPWLRQQHAVAQQFGDEVSRDKACQSRAQFFMAQEAARRVRQLLEERRAALGGERLHPALEVTGAIANSALALVGEEDPAAVSAQLQACLESAALPPDLRARAEVACVQMAFLADDLVAVRAHLVAALRVVAGAAAAAAVDVPVAAGADLDPLLRAELHTCASRLLRLEDARRPLPAPVLAARLERLREEFAAMTDAWRGAALRKGGIAFLALRQRRALVSELLALTMRVEGAERGAARALQDLLALQALGSSAREQNVPAVTVAEVRATVLGPRDGALLFLVAQHESHVCALDEQTVTLESLPGWAVLMPCLDELERALSRVPLVADGDARRELGQDLVRHAQRAGALFLPAAIRARMAAWEHVIVVDHGLPAGLPLECATFDADGRDLLGERFAVSTLSSLPVGVAWQRTRHRVVPRAAASLGLVATLRADPRLVPAAAGAPAFPRDRAARLQACYAAATRPLLDDDAHRGAIAGWRSGSPITQFIAHGAQAEGGERPAGLALTPCAGDDGFLGCEAIERGTITGVVVLSACGVGRPLRRAGDESYLGTLGGAFLRAGAHTVIESAAEQPLQPHLALIEHLHREVAAGRSISEALRRARVAVRLAAREGDVVDRFLHAQVRAHGLGHRAVIE